MSQYIYNTEKFKFSFYKNFKKAEKEEKEKMGNRENNKSVILPSLIPENKYSYSYHKPLQINKSLEIQNIIIESKYKLLSEKFNLENINKTKMSLGLKELN